MSKTNPGMIKADERRVFVLNERKQGFTFREIRDRAIKHFGKEKLPKNYDERYVYRDVSSALTRIREQLQETAEQVLVLELERLDTMFINQYRMAINGDQSAVDRCLKIMKRRDSLLGLDKTADLVLGGDIKITVGGVDVSEDI
jgi:hypothetical protein